jgi:tripeptidyl-peptidase I
MYEGTHLSASTHSKMLLWQIIALALSQLASATPLAKRFDDYSVRHAWNEVPNGWEFHSVPAPEHRFKLRIDINSANPDDLINTLYEVSDPKHSRYVQYSSLLHVY